MQAGRAVAQGNEGGAAVRCLSNWLAGCCGVMVVAVLLWLVGELV
jgi:hypothetical protein